MAHLPRPSVIALVGAPWLVVGGMALAALGLRLAGVPDPHDELLLGTALVLLGLVSWPIVLVCWTRDLFTMRRLDSDPSHSSDKPHSRTVYLAGD